MEWVESVENKVWLFNNKYRIVRAVRFKNDKNIPPRLKNLGPEIFHCYDYAGKYLGQSNDLNEAKKKIEKISG